jgi:hypothetical protein
MSIWYLNYDNCYLNLKIVISILETIGWIWKILFEYENCYFNSLKYIFEFGNFDLSLKIGLSLL